MHPRCSLDLLVGHVCILVTGALMTRVRPSRRLLACVLGGLSGAGLVVLFALSVASRAGEADIPPDAASPKLNNTLVAGQPLTIPFPRLGMWWPDPWTQPITDIARYDWVILGDWEHEFITPLKTINPGILLLNSTNACEVTFDPDHDPDHWSNSKAGLIPSEWYLTQVGSVLAADVDTTTTKFPDSDGFCGLQGYEFSLDISVSMR
jgi:hypothetical protein